MWYSDITVDMMCVKQSFDPLIYLANCK